MWKFGEVRKSSLALRDVRSKAKAVVQVSMRVFHSELSWRKDGFQ